MIKKTLCLLFCLLFCLLTLTSQAADTIPLKIFTQQQKLISFEVEVANTKKQIRKGLQHRESLPKKKGMLFIFPTLKPHAFWMLNTKISLDILFIDDQYRIVHIVKNTIPLKQKDIGRFVPSLYVLEINAGLSDEYGIELGDLVLF